MSNGGLLAAVALVAAAFGARFDTLGLAAGFVLVALSWRGGERKLRAAAAFQVCVAALLTLQYRIEERRTAVDSAERMAEQVAAVEARAQALTRRLSSAASDAAALPGAPDAARRRQSRASLFVALEDLRQRGGAGDIALALRGRDWSPTAWAGRVQELAGLGSALPRQAGVFVVEGSVSTLLVAAVPLPATPDTGIAYATAETTLATRRNIENAYLHDFDRLTEDAPNLEIRYVDLRDSGPGEHPFPPGPPGGGARTDLVKSASGTVVASLRTAPPRVERLLAGLRATERRGLSLASLLPVLLWLFQAPCRWRLAVAACLLRLILLALGPPLPAPGSAVLASAVFSMAPVAAPGLGWLPMLARTPVDLLLTSLLAACLAGLLLEQALRRAPSQSHAVRTLCVDLAALALVAGVYLSIFQIVTQCSLDLEDVGILPRSAPLLVMQSALLLVLATGAALLTALFSLAGPLPDSKTRLLGRALAWSLALAAAWRYWPREELGLPLVPALATFTVTALLAGTRTAWLPRLARASLGARAGTALLGVSALALLLFPSLVHFDEKALRHEIETRHAPLVLRQPQSRDFVLRETRRKIDELGLLENQPTGPHPPEIEELAYAVWSATDLSKFGFSSAVEVQDASGAILSRFALNLPSIGATRRPLPKTTDWELLRELSTVASAEQPVFHACRLLAYDGRIRGAVHVFIGDDYWNLPFLEGRDPYSVLYRSARDTTHQTRPLGLLVYRTGAPAETLFSSEERPPALDAAFPARAKAAEPAGFWTTLMLDGRQQHVYLFSANRLLYGISYARTDAGRYLADLLEAVLSSTLVALLTLGVFVVARTLLRRDTLSLFSLVAAVRRRFALRLFAAFMLVALVPVLVLEHVVERFVTDRLRSEASAQALELAAVAKKTVEDYALFQRDESPGDQPVTDDALVWVASLIRNDLDVFEAGRLAASSKRELYASGLLSQRLSGEAFRAVALEGEPSSLRTESIGGFSYQMVSVPLRFETGGTRVLSIPLALRQRELEAVVEDLRRSARLASVVFLAAAAALAVWMSRRISGPIQALTLATHRVAAGDFEARVSATTRDELRDLVDSFNRMGQDLERQRHDLERTNRLAAWAEMARQVAHEVKNPLTPIQLAAEHLRRVYAAGGGDFGATLHSCTDTILKQVRTLRGIATEFSSFARPPALDPEPLDLGALLQEVARSYRDVLPPDVRFELQLEAAPRVPADKRLVERAVVNLVENALQAVGESGAVRLRLYADGGRAAVIEVEDNGPGLDPEVLSRIFEPFFSTKANGSGLGLALVKKIAEDHGGGVTLESGTSDATRARLWFPVAP